MHMKKYLGFLAILLMAFSIGATSVMAVEGTSERDNLKEKRESVKKEIEAKRETWKKEFETKREEAKAKFEALREGLKAEKDAAKAKLKEFRLTGREKALERFDAAIGRMTSLKEKVDAQNEKLEAKGIDTSSAEALSAQAGTKLDEAEAKVTAATTLLGTSIEKLTEENKTELRTLAQETQTLIREAQTFLKEAVKSLKDAVKAKREASRPVDSDEGENETE